ncbi:MAG: hypothetical protein LBD52_00200 [Prevotellaceae bacterium]|nr:hypothetical protein [Prevotellaceae bacterium]
MKNRSQVKTENGVRFPEGRNTHNPCKERCRGVACNARHPGWTCAQENPRGEQTV